MIIQKRTTLVVPRGLPGAGKTTEALRWVSEDPDRRVRVGSDDIAIMLHPHAMTGGADVYRPHHAEREQLAAHAVITVLLQSGVDVVWDAPFLLPDYLADARELAERSGADLVIWDMTDMALDECIARDRQRGRDGGNSVGEHAIRLQHQLLHAAGSIAASANSTNASARLRSRT